MGVALAGDVAAMDGALLLVEAGGDIAGMAAD
jgi:hypothetical protein